MDGVNNAFCMSKEEYELARLATKCAGLQGKIDDQVAEIDKLENKVDRLEWENKGIAEWRDVAKEYKALCDQMATVMTNAIEHRWPYLDDMRSALEAWRAMK